MPGGILITTGKAGRNTPLQQWLSRLDVTSYMRADLYRILLLNGQYLCATSAQGWDINFAAPNDVTRQYMATQNGSWERGAIKSVASPKIVAGDTTLSVISQDYVNYPGTSMPLMSVVQAGLFDKAIVDIYTIYWGPGETPYIGLQRGFEHKYTGEILQVTDLDRTKAKFKLADPTYRLNLAWPRNLIQSSCRHTLFDSVCTLNQANYAFYNSIASGSNQLVLNLGTALTQGGATSTGSPIAAKWNSSMTFVQGKLLFTSGQNNGLWYYIKVAAGSQITLSQPTQFPVAVGDTMTMYPGCAKTIPACQNQYNNFINIGSFPFVPNPELGI